MLYGPQVFIFITNLDFDVEGSIGSDRWRLSIGCDASISTVTLSTVVAVNGRLECFFKCLKRLDVFPEYLTIFEQTLQIASEPFFFLKQFHALLLGGDILNTVKKIFLLYLLRNN